MTDDAVAEETMTEDYEPELEVLQQPPEAEPVWTFGGSPDEEAYEDISGDDSTEEAFGRYGSDASLDDEGDRGRGQSG